MHISRPIPLDLPLAIGYRNHQKSLTYFSHLALLVLFFLLKGRVKKGGAWHYVFIVFTESIGIVNSKKKV